MRTHTRIFLAAIVAALAVVGLVAAPTPAQAAPATRSHGTFLKAGPHHTVSPTLWAGLHVVDGQEGYCISPNLLGPDGKMKVGAVPVEMPPAEATAAARIVNADPKVQAPGLDLNRYHTIAHLALSRLIADHPNAQRTPDARAAARGLAADFAGYVAQLRPADRDRLTALVKFGRKGAPKFTVSPQVRLPGQVGYVTVTARYKDGTPAAAVPVNVAATGATMMDTDATTNNQGRVGFRFHATSLSPLFTAAATVPSSTRVLFNTPGPGRQRIVGGRFTDRIVARAGYTVTTPAFTVKWECSSDCDGNATLTATGKNATGADRLQLRITDTTGKQVMRLVVPGGTTRTLAVRVRDGLRARTETCYLGVRTACATPVVKGKVFEIVCPAAPSAHGSKPCPCKGPRPVTYRATIPVSPRHYVLTLTNGAKTVQVRNVTGGQTRDLTVTATKGQKITLSYAAFGGRVPATGALPKALDTGVLDSFTQG